MSEKGRRAHGVDLLRMLAAVQMISGHTIDALIAPEHRSGPIWESWTVARGLTAVAFLFASGVAFAMVAAQSPERRGPRVRRALMLIGISYALHPPAMIFSGDPAAAAASIRELFAVDVLACIGVTLLTLETLARLRPSAFALGAGALGAAVIVLAPVTAPIEATGVAAPLLDYLTKSGGSLFPLLPFSGFALLGAAVGSAARPREPGPRPARVLALSAVGLALAALAWDALSAPPPGAYYAWPAASFARIASVCGLALVLTLATRRVERLPAWMTTLAGETLFLYVSHLLVLYAGGIGLVHFLGGTLSVAQSVGVAAIMVITCGLAALAWARRKARRPARVAAPRTS